MPNIFLIFIASFLCMTIIVSDCKKFPNYIDVCHRNDPKLSQCVKNSINKAKPFIPGGMQELGINQVEPIHATEVFSSQPAGPSKSVLMTVGSIKIYGCSNFVVKELSIDMEERELVFSSFFPEIYVVGEYSASGYLIIFPVSGSGKLSANYTNTVGKFVMGWDIVTKKDNKDYMEAKTIKLDIQVNSAKHVYFENFMSSEKTLSELINVIINYGISHSSGFWDIISGEITKGVEERLGPVFLEHINHVLRQFTYDEMFPVL